MHPRPGTPGRQTIDRSRLLTRRPVASAPLTVDQPLQVPDLGPGTVELRSPNCCARWEVSVVTDGLPQTALYMTGPATAAAVWAPAGMTAVAQVVQIADFGGIVRPDGTYRCNWGVTTGVFPQAIETPQAALEARFYPEVVPEELFRGRSGTQAVSNDVNGLSLELPVAENPTAAPVLPGLPKVVNAWGNIDGLGQVTDPGFFTPGYANRISLWASEEVQLIVWAPKGGGLWQIVGQSPGAIYHELTAGPWDGFSLQPLDTGGGGPVTFRSLFYRQ